MPRHHRRRQPALVRRLPAHSEGLWKNTDYVFHRIFDETGVSDDERRKMLGANMARIFKCFEA